MDNNTVNRNHDETLYSVGEICRITGITRKTLFYYDRIGLLVPYERTEPQQFKLYDRERLERLNGIIEYRGAGFVSLRSGRFWMTVMSIGLKS